MRLVKSRDNYLALISKQFLLFINSKHSYESVNISGNLVQIQFIIH